MGKTETVLLGLAVVLGVVAGVRAYVVVVPNITLTVTDGKTKKPAANIPIHVKGINGIAAGSTDEEGVFRFGFISMEGARLIVCITTSAPGKTLELTNGLKAPDGANCRYICPSNNTVTCDIEDNLRARLVKSKDD